MKLGLYTIMWGISPESGVAEGVSSGIVMGKPALDALAYLSQLAALFNLLFASAL
jgi:hypothetical protein